MPQVNWPQILAALLGGGAVGAIITALVSSYRSRQQPVGRRIDLVPVFRPSTNAAQLQAVIAVTHSGNTVTFKNLFLAEVQVVNKGNRDLGELTFGATLGDGDRCIFVETSPPDQYHDVGIMRPASPEAPQHEIDFRLKPFNRGDSYSFKLYIVIPETRTEPQEIVLGSASPIKFVAMPTAGEILARAASEAVVTLGPLRIGLGR